MKNNVTNNAAGKRRGLWNTKLFFENRTVLLSVTWIVTTPFGPNAAPSFTCSTNFLGHGTGRQSNVGVPLHQPHFLNNSQPSLI